MEAFVEACHRAPSFLVLKELFPEIIGNRELHAKFLNTLSHLEYVGVRKMLKARNAEALDLEGLQHILEEAVHAVRLKKFAHSIAPQAVASYREECTLEGPAAERYFQAVDRSVHQHLSSGTLVGFNSSGANMQEAAYLLTSAAIEVRARCLYPAYQAALQQAGSKISVASILKDEEGHLQQMSLRLPHSVPQWRSLLEQILSAEELAFHHLLVTWQRALAQSKADRQ